MAKTTKQKKAQGGDKSTLIVIVASMLLMVVAVVYATSQGNKVSVEGSPEQAAKVMGANPHVKGAENPTVTLVEFADYDCSHCQVFSEIYPELLAAYPDDLQYVQRHYPLGGEQGASFREMLAAEAAAAQGAFWEYNDVLWQNYGMNTDDQLIQMAGQIGLDTQQFAADLSNATYRQRVLDDWQDGRDLGVTGTPALFLNGTRFTGSYEFSSVSRAIDSLIQSAADAETTDSASN